MSFSSLSKNIYRPLPEEHLLEARLYFFNTKNALIVFFFVVKLALAITAIIAETRIGSLGILPIVCDVFGLIGLFPEGKGYLEKMILMIKIEMTLCATVALIFIVDAFLVSPQFMAALGVLASVMMVIALINLWILVRLQSACKTTDLSCDLNDIENPSDQIV